MKGWRKIRSRAEDTCGGRKTFHLYIPEKADPAFWLHITEQYLGNKLPALEDIPSSRKAVVRAGRIPGSPYRHFFKLFFPRNRMEYIKQIFRKSRAYRDLKGSETAACRGLHVPEINCVIELRQWGIITSSIILTREAEEFIQLRKWLETLQKEGDNLSRRPLMRQIGTEMAKWHTAGMRHGDARDTNILCRIPKNSKPIGMHEKPKNLPIEFCWLDNERSRPVFRKRDFIRNLVQLNMTRNGVSITDRMRFWEAYWADAGHLYYPRTKKEILRKVIVKTRKRWEISGWL